METKRRSSKKRRAIFDALSASKEHPSAEMLYGSLKDKVPDLSLGTVYRNLAMFVEDGEAVSVGNVDGQERYDACTVPHPHFVCRRCGCVIDLELDADFAGMYDTLLETTGCRADYHSLTFYGLCEQCR